MSFFESFLGGAAQAGTNILQDQMKEEQVQRMAKFQEELAMERQRTINAMNQQNKIADEERAQARAEAPLKRMGGIIFEKRNQDVPLEAAPVTKLSGQGEAFDGQALTMGGLQGDPAKLRKMAEAMPDGEDKTNILKQLDNQMASDTKTTKDAVAGKTRKLTADEAEQAALSEALANDPVAYAAYQRDIGAPRRAERRVDIADAREVSRDKKADADVEDRRSRMDWQQEFQTRQLEQQKTLSNLAASRDSARESKADERARMSAITGIVKDTATEAKELRVRLADISIDPATKKIYESQLNEVIGTHKQALAQLSELAGIEAPEPAAAPKNAWNSATGDVISNGQVIGKAKSPEEAKAMLAQPKPQPSPSAATVTPTPSAPAQQFNEAGYADVQSTIDGAKRGDRKALAVLRQLIDRGETSPAQRQQIAKITGQN